MGYLESLKKQQELREKFDRDVDRMKIAVVQIESLVSLHDGEFLTELEELLIKWKNKET
jgi:hypothetical protein